MDQAFSTATGPDKSASELRVSQRRCQEARVFVVFIFLLLGFWVFKVLHITHSEGGWYLRSHWLTGTLHRISLRSGHVFLHARYLSYRKSISPTATECERGHCDIVSLPRTGFQEWHNIRIASAAVVVWADHIFGIDMSDVAWTRICRANTECHCG